MTNEKTKKVLLAIDGSERAMDAVWYVCKSPPFHNMKIVLFNVFSGIPESYRDLEKNPRFSKTAGEVLAWEVQQKKELNEYMQKAKAILEESGIPGEAVTIKIHPRKKGIARDIIKEAYNGYSAVLIGRKSSADFQEIVMGSVATKIVEKISFVPVLIIGKIPPDENILLAVDGSENAMHAVDFVAEMLGGFNYHIHLLHVVRGASESESDRLFFSKLATEEADVKMNVVFQDMKQRLINAGMKPDQIETEIITGAHSRAGSIVQQARSNNYGTIVVGRRGLSNVRSFFMGRVSNKIIHTIRNRTVWVVT